jgi:hypothetical protein
MVRDVTAHPVCNGLPYDVTVCNGLPYDMTGSCCVILEKYVD